LSDWRAHRGRIAAVDLVATMGWDFPRAEEEATRLLIAYGGEPEVSDDGVVLYVFKDIRKTAREHGADTIRPRLAWERMEHTTPLTGNSGATNTVIALFNGFNLLAPFWIVPAFEARLGVSFDHSFWLYTYPILFSSMVFAVPVGRWVVEKLRERARRRRNAWRGLVRLAIEHNGAAMQPGELARDPVAAQVLDSSLVVLGGDVVADDAGQVRYTFPRIKEELDAVARARAQAPTSEEEPGVVVFSSKDGAFERG
jgi:hypothetical protein